VQGTGRPHPPPQEAEEEAVGVKKFYKLKKPRLYHFSNNPSLISIVQSNYTKEYFTFPFILNFCLRKIRAEKSRDYRNGTTFLKQNSGDPMFVTVHLNDNFETSKFARRCDSESARTTSISNDKPSDEF